jgi:hypothetical protein
MITDFGFPGDGQQCPLQYRNNLGVGILDFHLIIEPRKLDHEFSAVKTGPKLDMRSLPPAISNCL